MTTRLSFIRKLRSGPWARRKGNIIVLSAALMVVLMGFTAFGLDIGYISMVRCQLNSASDGAALGGAYELASGLGPGTNPSQSTVANAAKTAAVNVAGSNRAGEKNSVLVNSSDNIRLGRRTNNGSGWTNSWGTQPYNLIEVSAIRGSAGSGSGDAALPLFFARALGQSTANLSVTSRAALLPGIGFKVVTNPGTGYAPILPIAYDLPSWNALKAGTGNDDYSYNTTTGAVTAGSDGIKEIDLYPYGNQSLVPGNRGTVKIGVSNNSTATLSDQIRYGVSDAQLNAIGGTIEIPSGSSITLGGNPGLSAAIKDDLTAIIGQPRAIPIFSAVSGPGNNAQFTIVRFVGIRILFVQLTGGNKRVIAQPAVVISDTVVAGNATTASDYVYTKPKLVE
jgi:Flp pilus assembly protein TadG